MKIDQIINEMTSSGAFASVSMRLGATQKRAKESVEVKGLKPVSKLKNAKKKGPYANSIVENKEQVKVSEAELQEDDLIIIPGRGTKRKNGFVPKGQSRVDHEVEMARSDVLATMKNAKSIYHMLKNRSEEEGIEGWVQEKLIKANDYLNAVKEYYDEQMMQEMNGGVIAAGGVGEGVAEGSTSKEKQKTPYRDINSPEYKAAAEKQKKKMANDQAAEPGNKLLDKIKKKGVAEGKWSHNAITGQKLDPRTGEILPVKEKPLTMKQMFAPKAQPKLTLDDVWRKVENVVSQIYPDGDPNDYMAPWLEKHGIRDFKIGEILDRAAKKNGYKDMYDYWNSMGEQGVAEGLGKDLAKLGGMTAVGIGAGIGGSYLDSKHPKIEIGGQQAYLIKDPGWGKIPNTAMKLQGADGRTYIVWTSSGKGNRTLYATPAENVKEGVAEGSNDLYQKAIRKYAQQVANDYLNGGNEYLYGANKFDAEMFGVSQEKANKDFKTWFTMIVRSQAVRPRRGVAEGYKEPTTAAGHAKMAAKIKKMLDDTLADRGDRHGNPDPQRLASAYEYHTQKAKEKSQGVAEGSLKEDEYDKYETGKMGQEEAVTAMFTRLARQGIDPIDMIANRFGWSTYELDDLAQQQGFENTAEWLNSFEQGVAEGFSDSRLVNLPGGNRNRPLPSSRPWTDEEKKKRRELDDARIRAEREKRKQQEKKQGVAASKDKSDKKS